MWFKNKYIQVAYYESDYEQLIILEQHANLETIKQIVTYVNKTSANGTPPHIDGLFCTLWISKATLNVYKNKRYKMAYVSFW